MVLDCLKFKAGYSFNLERCMHFTFLSFQFSCGEDRQVKCWDLEYNKVTKLFAKSCHLILDWTKDI